MSPDRVDLDELAALEEQRSFLLTSLEDLDREHEHGDLDDDDYETLRADYTTRAAQVIDAIENHQELIDATDPGGRGLRRVVLVAGVLVVAIVAGLVVATTSGSHRETANSDVMLVPSAATRACIDKMGETFGSSTDGAAFSTNAIRTLECFTERLEDDPDDVVALTYRARTESLLVQQLDGVASADDVANFATRAWADLSRALELAPDYPDALAFAAINAISEGDAAAARKYLDRIDRLQLPANSPILPLVNNAIRPALNDAPQATSTPSTTVG